MVTEEQILKALSHVDDPDLKKDLVSLGMIKNIKIENKHISFDVELTTPACPMKEMIKNACVTAIKHLIDPDLKTTVNMTSRVSQGVSGKNALPGIRNLIAVSSGKGGVGKSTIAANIAIGLAQTGARVGLLDADIYGPSIPTMFGLNDIVPGIAEMDGKQRMIPAQKFGIRIMSIGFLTQSGQAVVWRGPMLSAALKQLVVDVIWEDLDYLIVDMPPGTGDVHITLAQSFPLTGAIIVTTPQQVALDDAVKGASMYKMSGIDVPLLGVIENMSWFSPPNSPDKHYYLFGKGGGQKLADTFEVPLLGQIPLDIKICEGGDAGIPAVADPLNPLHDTFIHLCGRVAQNIAVNTFSYTSGEPISSHSAQV